MTNSLRVSGRAWRLVGAAVLLAACGHGAPPETAPVPVHDVFFHSPPDSIWAAMLVVFTDADVPIENIDKSSWFLRTQEMSEAPGATADSLLDCGKSSDAVLYTEYYGSRMRFTVLLRPAGDSTGVRLQSSMRIVSVAVPAANELPCVSRGKMEAQFIEALRRHLQPARR